MQYLLDTHIVLWAISRPEKIKAPIRAILEDSSKLVYVSAASLWEISIKYRLDKLLLKGITPTEIFELIKETGFLLLPLTPQEAATYHQLKTLDKHKDPFDRMIIWQAICGKYTLISADKQFEHYKKQGLKLLV